MNTATTRIRSQAFLPRKLITDPAVLKIKLTIAPIRPGSIPAIFFPSSLSPFPTPVATDLSPFVSESMITPITVPTAKNTAVTVNPYFLKMFLTFSLSETLSSSSSLSFSRVLICSNFSAIFLLLFPLLRVVHFNYLRFLHLLEWINVAPRFLFLFEQSTCRALFQEQILFVSGELDSTFVLLYLCL